MRKWGAWVVIFAALLGGGLSWLSIQHFYGLLQGGLEQPSFCNVSEQFNCDLVASSSYAILFGQPVAGFGLFYFLIQLLFGGWTVVAGPSGDRRPTAVCGGLLGLLALGYPVYLVFIMATRLHTFCLTCLGMDVAVLFTVIGWLIAVKSVRATPGWWGLIRHGWGAHAITTGIVIGVGWIFLASATDAAYDAAKQPRPTNAQIAQAIDAYKKGSLFDLQVATSDHPLWGNPNVPTTLVAFSDFQCPYCRLAASQLKGVLAEFRDRIRFLFINYPLDSACNPQVTQAMHAYACLAARAGKCAQQMGHFWEYHDDVFRNQQKLSREFLIQVATTHGMSPAAFIQCLDDPATEAAVKADIEIGSHVHVTGTPTLILNQRQVHIWRSRELLRAILRAELEKK